MGDAGDLVIVIIGIGFCGPVGICNAGNIAGIADIGVACGVPVAIGLAGFAEEIVVGVADRAGVVRLRGDQIVIVIDQRCDLPALVRGCVGLGLCIIPLVMDVSMAEFVCSFTILGCDTAVPTAKARTGSMVTIIAALKTPAMIRCPRDFFILIPPFLQLLTKGAGNDSRPLCHMRNLRALPAHPADMPQSSRCC